MYVMCVCTRRVGLSTKNTTTDDSLLINIEMLVSCSMVSFVDPTFIRIPPLILLPIVFYCSGRGLPVSILMH